jgi:hypothetical protein
LQKSIKRCFSAAAKKEIALELKAEGVVSFGALRLMVGCALTGQAAGAAALSKKRKIPLSEVDAEELRGVINAVSREKIKEF